MEEWVAAFAALAHDTRLAVVRLLMQQGPSGLPAGEIAARVDYPIVRLADLAAERGAPLDQVPRAPRRLSNRYSTRGSGTCSGAGFCRRAAVYSDAYLRIR